ncbi:hypothetical protein [Halonatronum saccharophilum]|uniref:hypothetical protein n=1 Tax=Halonatronum saccharophilum TaxID=150060 RepID=UPI000480EF4C|nr:hypothetical protein [Halonatronum saccharophilum]
MRVSANEISTTDELMKEFFGMHEKMIYNITEKVRYEMIYKFLKSKGATEEKISKFRESNTMVLKLAGDNYLIPNKVFDELDKQWVDKLKEKEGISLNKEKITTL